MLANGTLTPEGFFAAFPHVDLANAIYAANTGQFTPATVEWLWRENLYSQAALQQKRDDMAALRKALIDLQARDITEQDLLEMFPHLPIDQALALVNNPEGLYNLWMTEVGRAWVQDVEDRRNRERGWEATGQRYQGLAQNHYSSQIPTSQHEDFLEFLESLELLPSIGKITFTEQYRSILGKNPFLDAGTYVYSEAILAGNPDISIWPPKSSLNLGEHQSFEVSLNGSKLEVGFVGSSLESDLFGVKGPTSSLYVIVSAEDGLNLTIRSTTDRSVEVGTATFKSSEGVFVEVKNPVLVVVTIVATATLLFLMLRGGKAPLPVGI